MPKGMSLHVGLNRASVNAFKTRPLFGCENDAAAMREIAVSRGFHPDDARLLLGPEATFANVEVEIRRAAGLLGPGDLFLFTFAGHGSRIADTDEASFTGEPDGKDESIVLFDRLLIDDYARRELWPRFAPGVRIVGVADSCHSGTALFAMPDAVLDIEESSSVTVSSGAGVVASVTSTRRVEAVRHVAPGDAPGWEEEVVSVGHADRGLDDHVRREHREVYRHLYEDLKSLPPAGSSALGAGLLTLAACQDDEKTKDGAEHGAFTAALLKVWAGGAFAGDYVTFREKIQEQLPNQKPVLETKGLPSLSAERPFTI